VFDNQRQVAEASPKEGKGLSASRHLPARHAAGIARYQEPGPRAQNLLRWFRRQVLGATALATAGVKELVRAAANSRALLVDRRRRLAAASRWPGLPLRPSRGSPLRFPFLDGSRAGASRPVIPPACARRLR
jgi:hypothetical protein